ncbi:MAG TPA: efflux RND transporter periplasmic adaptor subunit [Segetibacter sp.]|nr:efflux RND transporter periplasmic adaptor subunit [Segetibacter sp.]
MRSLIMILLTISLAACNGNKPTATTKKEEIKVDSVNVFILKKDSVQRTLTIPGELLPNETVQVRAKVPGYIRKINVDIGSRVRKGQVLATIDAPEINTRVQELNAKVSAANARYQSSKDYYERINIASKADGVIAASELERTKNQMMADKAEYNANLYAASSYKKIGNYLAIIAPYSGTITKRNIDPGSFVGNSNENPLFELEDNSKLSLKVPIPEVYAGATLLSNSAEITTRSLPDQKFKATLSRKSGSFDRQTRSEIWEFEISNNGGKLKPGSYADVKLHFIRPQSAFVVPSSAVVTTLEKRFVIKVVNNTTKWVDVRPGFNMGEKQEVFGDLNAGDTLIQKSNEELKAETTIIPKLLQ